MRKYTPEAPTPCFGSFTPSSVYTEFRKVPYTPEQDEILRRMYLTHSHLEIGMLIGRVEKSVRNRCWVLGLRKRNGPWTEAEYEQVRQWYADHESGKGFFLDELSRIMHRSKCDICDKAAAMGLTRKKRFYGHKEPRKPMFATEPERIAFRAAQMRQWYSLNKHPRGYRGHKHSADTRAKISARSIAAAAKKTPEQRSEINMRSVQTKIAKYGTAGPTMLSSNAYSRTKSGKRADLGGQFFRSRWEANYARYLRMLVEKGQIKSWEFEPKTFVFVGVTRGQLTYTPDFRITENDGSQVWHEVKGWMDAKSKAKLKRFAKFFPEEKLIVIAQPEYKAIAQYARLIEGWEDE